VQRIPYLLVAGDKEVAANTISVRDRTGQDLGVMEIAQFEALLQQDIENYSRL
jgi:threonyl-tRNA synthetase